MVPNLIKGKSVQVKAGDNAEVGPPALESPEQVRILFLVRINNRSIAEDDL